MIRLAVLTSRGSTSDDKLWSPLILDLRSATGLKASALFIESGAALVEAMHRRHVDFALVSGDTALAAVRRADAEVFARAQTLAPLEAAVLVVGDKSPLTLARVLGCDRTLLLGVSGGGRDEALLAADAFLFAPRGVGPSRCFRDVRPASPPALLGDVVASRLDAAILDQGQVEANPRGAGRSRVRALWRSPPTPSPSLVWRRDLDPAVKEKLRQFFLTYGQDDAGERQRLAALGLASFAAADDSHLLIQREMDAAHAWLEAKAAGDKTKADQARTAFDALTAERQDLEARTGAPAGAQ